MLGRPRRPRFSACFDAMRGLGSAAFALLSALTRPIAARFLSFFLRRLKKNGRCHRPTACHLPYRATAASGVGVAERDVRAEAAGARLRAQLCRLRGDGLSLRHGRRRQQGLVHLVQFWSLAQIFCVPLLFSDKAGAILPEPSVLFVLTVRKRTIV